MPKVVYTPTEGSRFGVPAGSYLARFVRTEDREPFQGPSKFSKEPSTEPRLEWFFEVEEGEDKGKLITQTTGTTLSGPRAGFTKMVKGLLGRMPVAGESIDTDEYLGRLYQIEVEVNPASDSGNLHIGFMKPVQEAKAVAPAPKPPATTPTGGVPQPNPPLRRNVAPPPAVAGTGKPACDPAEPWIWWDEAEKVERQTTRGELFKMIGDDPKVLDSMARRPGPGQPWQKVEATDLSLPF